jgi:hypothetical protein
MGGEWYSPFVIYGYTIKCPSKMDYMKFANKIYKRYDALNKKGNIKIKSILPEFHSDMEYDENSKIDSDAHLVIGIIPKGEIDELLGVADELENLITFSSTISSLELSENASFHCGIEWFREVEYDDSDDGNDGSEDDDDSEDDEDEYSESEEEDDDSDEEDDEEDTNDKDELIGDEDSE